MSCLLDLVRYFDTYISGELSIIEDDGSVRVYNLPSTRVFKAINNLGSDVSSLVTVSRQGAGTEELWLSCGPKV